MFRFLENITDSKQYFDELQEYFRKGLTMLFGGFRKYVGR